MADDVRTPTPSQMVDALVDILTSAEYEHMEATGKAAELFALEWHETQDRYVTTAASWPLINEASVERQAPAAEALAAAHALLRRASDYLHFFSPTENYPVSPLRDDIDAALAATPTTPHQRIVHLAATPEPPAREVDRE